MIRYFFDNKKKIFYSQSVISLDKPKDVVEITKMTFDMYRHVPNAIDYIDNNNNVIIKPLPYKSTEYNIFLDSFINCTIDSNLSDPLEYIYYIKAKSGDVISFKANLYEGDYYNIQYDQQKNYFYEIFDHNGTQLSFKDFIIEYSYNVGKHISTLFTSHDDIIDINIEIPTDYSHIILFFNFTEKYNMMFKERNTKRFKLEIIE